MNLGLESFIKMDSAFDELKGVLWDIPEVEEIECPITPTQQGNLDWLIDSTFSEVKNTEKSPEQSPLILEKDVFGRESVKHCSAWKYRPENYGKVYNLMNGVEVPLPKLEGLVMRSASQVSYLEKLYTDYSSENLENYCSSLLLISKDTPYKRGSIFKPPSNYCFRATSAESYQYITTFDIQSSICAVLNSKNRFLWLIGAESDGKIVGCCMSYAERDCFRQGLDFALSTEFVPPLAPETVEVRFIPIDREYDPDLYLIEISLNTIVANLYQLSSGRIFYNDKGYPSMLKSMNDARLMLLDRKLAHYYKLQTDAVGFRRVSVLRVCENSLKPLRDAIIVFAGGIVLGFVIKKYLL